MAGLVYLFITYMIFYISGMGPRTQTSAEKKKYIQNHLQESPKMFSIITYQCKAWLSLIWEYFKLRIGEKGLKNI